MKQIQLPNTWHDFTNIFEFDIQFNRFIMGVDIDEIKAISPKIKNLSDWKRELLSVASTASNEKRHLNAAYYYRLAEFYISPGDPDKEYAYDNFIIHIEKAFKTVIINKHSIHYENTFIPAVYLPAKKSKGTILFTHGFDSLLEEGYYFFDLMRSYGFNVISFDGPGQGATLIKQNTPMTHEWEKVIKCVLDYFKLDEVIIIGASLGGYFAIRSAAFEPRIKKVISFDVLYNFLECIIGKKGFVLRYMAKIGLFFHLSFIMNFIINGFLMKRDVLSEWGFKHGMYTMGCKSPYEFLKKCQLFNCQDISKFVSQDVLVLAGAEDHYVPFNQFFKQIKALSNAKSVTGRIFTKKENAQNHCQIGNMGLAFNVMMNWLQH